MFGWVEISGVVVPLQHIEAPLSGERCVLYCVTLARRQRLREWRDARITEVGGVWFGLQTEHGLLLVDPSCAMLRLHAASLLRLHLGQDGSRDARVQALYARLSRGSAPARIAAREQRVQAAAPLQVAGRVRSHPDPRGTDGSYRTPPRLPLIVAETIRAIARARRPA